MKGDERKDRERRKDREACTPARQQNVSRDCPHKTSFILNCAHSNHHMPLLLHVQAYNKYLSLWFASSGWPLPQTFPYYPQIGMTMYVFPSVWPLLPLITHLLSSLPSGPRSFKLLYSTWISTAPVSSIVPGSLQHQLLYNTWISTAPTPLQYPILHNTSYLALRSPQHQPLSLSTAL